MSGESKGKSNNRVRYFALHKEGLRNGSFFRVRSATVCAQFINGDFMGNVGQLPETYAGRPLVEFPREQAEELIPECCLPGKSSKRRRR
jgi:hypothetical protein